MARVWIDDGITQKKPISPKMGTDADGKELRGATIEFSFRPPMSDAVLNFDEAQALPGPQRVKSLYDFIIEHAVGWDNTNKAGEATQVTMETLKRVPVEYLFAMRDEIFESSKQFAALAKN